MVSGQVLWPRGVVLRSCPGDYIFGDGFRGQRDCSGLGFRGQGWFSAEAWGPGRSFGMPGMALESGLGPRGCFWGQTYGFGRCFGDQRIVSGQVLHPGDGLGNGGWFREWGLGPREWFRDVRWGAADGFRTDFGAQRWFCEDGFGMGFGVVLGLFGNGLGWFRDCLRMVWGWFWDGFGMVLELC